MAAASHQQHQGNGHLKSISSSNSPFFFFKIILQDTIRNGKFEIPPKFVKIFGNGMSSPAMLGVPSGAVWKVELTKCDGKTWLEKGWLEFSNHYSLGFGHFLVFRYDGNSNFHVLIFDKSASEIQYPLTIDNHRRSEKILEQIIDRSQDDDSLNILDSASSSRKMREKSQLPCPWPPKMMRSINSAIKTEFNGKPEFLAQSVRYNEKFKGLERASDIFKSENPLFQVVMQRSNVGQDHGQNYRLVIPRNFVEKHLMKQHCSVILFSSTGETWNATFNQKRVGKRLYSILQAGWGTFVRDNNIQLGDVCSFELINSIEISFKVVIHKGQDETCHRSLASTDAFRRVKRNAQTCASPSWTEPLTDLQKAKAFQVAGGYKSKNPFFGVVLQPSYINSNRLIIPVKFARQHLTKIHKEVILLSNGKSWPVTYYQHGIESTKPFVTLCNGWHGFAVDNGLEVGDACVFELIKGAKTSMKVTIFKKQAVKDANLGSSFGDICRIKQVVSTETAWIKEKGDMSNLHNKHPRITSNPQVKP